MCFYYTEETVVEETNERIKTIEHIIFSKINLPSFSKLTRK